ncbi:hypothetical protein NM208_g1244 [Fusarium decemcellulare]|uniref:Uncharacterized protein n=1 Tax=Fusarium decemcellulare TaxID=57161 RepID=A0ACC1SWS3_9HYPO|nr:hypothetical protein NM208_g1244 [Fusarium decemcellulare]
MKLTSSLVVLNWVLVPPILAGPDQNIYEVCNSVDGARQCDGTLIIPVSSGPEYCTVKGQRKQCGVKINTKEVNVCDAIRKVMPDNSFLDSVNFYCGCLDQTILDSRNTNLWLDGEIGLNSPNLLDAALRNERCLADRDYAIKTNRRQVIDTQLVAKDGWTILRAPEIDVARYRGLLHITWDCYMGECQEGKLLIWFSNWFDDADEIRESQFSYDIQSWPVAIEMFRDGITLVESAANTVQNRIKTASSKISTVQQRICQRNACTGKVVSAYLKNVTTALERVNDLQDIPAAANKATKYIPTLLSRAQQAADAFQTVPGEDALYSVANNGKLNTMRDIMKLFVKLTEVLPTAAAYIRKNLYWLIALTKHSSRVNAAATFIKVVLAPDWKANKDLSRTESSRKVRDGLIQIQSIIKTDLQGDLNILAQNIDGFDKKLSPFPLRGKRLELKFGAVGYNRSIVAQFEYPCRPLQKKIFKSNGFEREYWWSIFTKGCHFDAQEVYLPKHWIPYLKYRYVQV